MYFFRYFQMLGAIAVAVIRELGWKQLVGKLARMDEVNREKNLCEKNDVGRNWDGATDCQDGTATGSGVETKAVGTQESSDCQAAQAGREEFEKEQAHSAEN